jgi:hypothetical protein
LTRADDGGQRCPDRVCRLVPYLYRARDPYEVVFGTWAFSVGNGLEAALPNLQVRWYAARLFRQTVFACPASIGKQANFFAIRLISAHMGLPFEGRHGLQNLALKLDREVSKGCQRASAELRGRRDSGFRLGETWELWMRKLTNILSNSELPTRVRKGTDKIKTARPSPFVLFVRELQACLPATYRRSHALRSDFEANIALSTAIVRSRSSGRVAKRSLVGPE